MKDFYYHINRSGAVFVKDGDFFISQGGLEKDWGKHWKKIKAESLDQAREIGEIVRATTRQIPVCGCRICS